MIEAELLENKERREEMIDRIDMLDNVGNLLMLPNTNYSTTEQVATYYKVGIEAIKSIVFNNRDEIMSDGTKNLTGKETKEFLGSCKIKLANYRGYFTADGHKMNNRNNLLFSKRAILRIGMLLRDSEVAKEIRTRLLDIFNDVEKEQPQIINNIVNEIRTEQAITADIIQAMYEGDYAKESQLKTELLGLRTNGINGQELV